MNFITLPSASPADDWVQPLVNALNIPTDQVKYFVNCLIGPFLMFALRYLPNNPTLKHIVYGGLGFLASYLLFGLEVFTVLYTSLPVYFIMKYNKTSKASMLCFVIVFGYLLVRNIYLYFTQYLVWSLDFTATHMVITLKLTAFAFSVTNGQKDKNITAYLDQHKITNYPNILEYLGFVYFYPGMFSGPSLEYRDYISFIDMSRFAENNFKLPNIPVFNFLKHYLGGTFLLLFYAFINSNPPPSPEYHIEKHPEESGLLFKLFTIWISCSILRLKYYGTWKLTECMGEVSACGYSGKDKDGKDLFLLYKNVSIMKFETSKSCKVNMDVWNTYVQHWLKNYVYVSFIGTPVEKFKTDLTMFTCAVYHGVYPGYYISFLILGFDKDVSNLIYKRLDPYMKEKFGEKSVTFIVYDVLVRIWNHWHLNYTIYPFTRFEFFPSLKVFARTYFLGIVSPLIVYVWLKYFPPGKKQVKKDVKEDKKNE